MALYITEHPDLCIATFFDYVAPGRARAACRAQYWVPGDRHPRFGPTVRTEAEARASVAHLFPVASSPDYDLDYSA